MALRWCAVCIVLVILVACVSPSIQEPTVKPTGTAKPSAEPHFFKKPESSHDNHYVGESIKLRCKVRGHPKPFLHWFKEGNLIDHVTDYRIKINRYALVIENAQLNDTGKYACRGKNQHGMVWGNFTVKVKVKNFTDETEYDDDDEILEERTTLGKPEWSSKKQDHETIARPANSYVDLKCPAVGNPKPRIKWLFNRRTFKGNAAGLWNMKGYKLTLGDLVPKDSGHYTCIVSNLYGSINWTYTLQVVQRLPHAPEIDGPKNQTVRVGEDAVFDCKIVMSDLHLHLQWLQHYKVNGSYTTSDGDPYVTVLQMVKTNRATA